MTSPNAYAKGEHLEAHRNSNATTVPTTSMSANHKYEGMHKVPQYECTQRSMPDKEQAITWGSTPLVHLGDDGTASALQLFQLVFKLILLCQLILVQPADSTLHLLLNLLLVS